MAELDAQIVVDANLVRAKRGKNRRALKPKNPSANEANILAGKASLSPLLPSGDVGKNQEETFDSPKKKKATSKVMKESFSKSFEKDLQEMQGKLEELRLEKEKTEELLKARDEMLKQREEELESRGREQENLQSELKKLQKLKEFKPTMSFPLVQSLREEQEKEKKKKANPEKKRPSTAYALWCKDQWNEVKKENPDAEFKEISNMLGAKWKNISAEEKKPYKEKYQAHKEAYLQIIGKEKRENEAMKLLEEEQKQKTAMELLEQYLQFKQEVDKENMDKENKKKKERDPLKPKQPLSAFFLYSKDRRADLLEESKNILEVIHDLMKRLPRSPESNGKICLKSNEDLMKRFIAKKHKKEYLLEMEIYKRNMDEDAATRKQEEEELMKIQKQEALQLLKKKEKTENMMKKTKEQFQKKKKEDHNADPNKPKRPASSFLLFSKETRKSLMEERPGTNNSTLNAMVSVKWKELNEADKKIWNDKAAEAMEAYKKELEEYNKSNVASQ